MRVSVIPEILSGPQEKLALKNSHAGTNMDLWHPSAKIACETLLSRKETNLESFSITDFHIQVSLSLYADMQR